MYNLNSRLGGGGKTLPISLNSSSNLILRLKRLFQLFLCLGFIVSFDNFSLFTGEGLQILTYTRDSWPLSCEGSLECHANCDMGHPLIMVISEDP